LGEAPEALESCHFRNHRNRGRTVLREDLKKLPDNGWSLYGLAESLRAQKKNADEAKATRAKFQKIWAKADTKITSSCLCQPTGMAGEGLGRTGGDVKRKIKE
jgi:hypothetical protein